MCCRCQSPYNKKFVTIDALVSIRSNKHRSMHPNKSGPKDSVKVLLGFKGERPSCDHGKTRQLVYFFLSYISCFDFQNSVGPMLLFQRSSNLENKFFACSAYRDRKLCPAFVLEINWEKEQRKGSKVLKKNPLVVKSHELNTIRESIVNQTKPEERSFCQSCGELFLKSNIKQHLNHTFTKEVSDSLLQNPSQVWNKFLTMNMFFLNYWLNMF